MQKSLILILSMFLCSHAFASTESLTNELQTKHLALNNLTKQIRVVQKKLNQAQVQRNDLVGQLQSTETSINNLIKTIHHNRSELSTRENELKKLVEKDQVLQKNLRTQQALLGEQLRCVYEMGHLENIKLLLNQENPNHMSRLLHYHQYIRQSRDNYIAQVNNTLKDVLVNKQKILASTQQLHTLVKTTEEHQQALAEENAKRSRIINVLEVEIHTHQDTIQTLMQDKQRLANLLAQLQERARARPARSADLGGFVKALWLPTNGKITLRFGQYYANSKLQSSGIFISAPIKQAVNAIDQGDVIFSDYLRGYGLLVIIDHGKGYLSLYGHNQNVYVKKDDRVHQGQVIASTGNTSAEGESGLYFEVRHMGRPIDPLIWCNRTKMAQ